jgi:hypothetical protein
LDAAALARLRLARTVANFAVFGGGTSTISEGLEARCSKYMSFTDFFTFNTMSFEHVVPAMGWREMKTRNGDGVRAR